MSQDTYTSPHNVFSWNGAQQKRNVDRGYNQTHSSSSKTNGQATVQPVQRIDSFTTSSSSHEPFSSTFSTDSSFNFDHPTPPVDSADEHNFHTPEIEDLLWQENYNEDGTLHVENDSTIYQHHQGHFVQNPPHSAGLASHKNSLPSPQSTNISTPEASGHTKQPSQNSTIFTSPMSTPLEFRRQFRGDVDMSPEHNPQLYTPMQNTPQITSPIIQISSHPRGDSPARSEFEGPRLSKKRSASNLSQGEYPPDDTDTTQSAMLMPPMQDEEPEWEHDDDRAGISPAHRDSQEHPSFEDIEQQHEQDKTVSEVQHWLSATSLDPSSANRYARGQIRPDRLRSRSTGARSNTRQQPILKSNMPPGPGALIDENSDYYYSSSDEESNISLIAEDHPETHAEPLPPRRDSEVAPNELGPLGAEYHRSGPWQDSHPTSPPTDGMRSQPESSNAAIYKFALKAKEFDTLSRRATWGTQLTERRRLSDGDMDSLLETVRMRHPSLSKTRSKLLGAKAKVKEQYLKRSNSRSRQTEAEPEKVQSPEPMDDRSSTDSQPNPSVTSFPKIKQPSISSALRGATGSLAAVGAGATGLNIETEHQQENFLKRTIRRVRSKSDANRSPKSPVGFKSMIAHEGGMPFATLASPSQEYPTSTPQNLTPVATTQEVRAQTHSPVKMPLSPRPANVIPNLEGFKVQILELNPRLAPYLVERIAHDQVRRYKRLVNNKVEHVSVCAEGTCRSGHLCSSVGGEAEILPTRSSGRDATMSSAQFKIAPGPDSDNEDSAFDGIVTPAAFPDGIPLPPTKKLPARFECPLCFQVKTFQKPSDWTKHVHEDVQPFTCTFPGCQEPKSFKRKADWVRHENERHRHLEWWKCNLSECTHVCYRKDNFVQHLVREHKRKEPKIRSRANPNAKGKGKGAANTFNQEEQEFWNLVDECRHEGATDAKSEPCKFCNNVCASWKKLSVHVGKHMEQIAMPVLDLAQKRNVTKDTIISPIEPLSNKNMPFYGNESTIIDMNSALSPFSQSGPSYHSSSAEHSPMAIHPNPPSRFGIAKGGVLTSTYGANGMQQVGLTSAPYGYGVPASSAGFPTFVGPYDGSQYGSYSGQQVMYTQGRQVVSPDGIPRTNTGIDTSYVNMHPAYDDQSQYFSSPEQQYMSYQAGTLMGQSHMQMQTPNHGQTPVTPHNMAGNGFVYTQQQPWTHQ